MKSDGLQVISAERICKTLSLCGYNPVLWEDLKHQHGWENNFPVYFALYVERSDVDLFLLREAQESLIQAKQIIHKQFWLELPWLLYALMEVGGEERAPAKPEN